MLILLKWRRLIIRFFSLLILLLLGMRSFLLTENWRNNMNLYSSILAINLRSYVAHSNLGQTLENAGLIEEAIDEYREAATWSDLVNSDQNQAHY